MRIADKWLYCPVVSYNLIPSDLWDEVSGIDYKETTRVLTKDETEFMLNLVSNFLGEEIVG